MSKEGFKNITFIPILCIWVLTSAPHPLYILADFLNQNIKC